MHSIVNKTNNFAERASKTKKENKENGEGKECLEGKFSIEFCLMLVFVYTASLF